MRNATSLPQPGGPTFITDGGMETTLIFHAGLDLPHFAAFVLLDRPGGEEELRRYYAGYVELARAQSVGIVLDTPTWRASADWGEKLGYSADALADVNRRSVALLEDVRAGAGGSVPIVISGCIGPRGDGYVLEEAMTAEEAQDYHHPQVAVFAETAAELVSALTMTSAEEATGIARAAQEAGIPVVISFTVETDGRLPSGQPLKDAVEQVDRETNEGPAYFMVNCAYPTHLAPGLEPDGPWRERIIGLRANASKLSHAELDEAEELDEGNPRELAQDVLALRESLPTLTVVGGCCGTDERHIGQVCAAFSR